MKICTKCGEAKLLSEFGKHAKLRDGLNCWCKVCAKASYAKWRAANIDKAVAASAKWYAANSDKGIAATKKWAAANREKLLISKAKYRAANAEKISAYRALYNAAHKEQISAYGISYRAANYDLVKSRTKAWKSANPDRLRIYTSNRKAKVRSGSGSISTDISSRLYKLQRGKCACCGLPLGKNYHLDHIMPLALGGTNTDDNIQLLRAKCNMEKHMKHPVDFMQQRGFLL